MSEELKPCPFCNGRPRLVAPVWDLLPYCECLRCGVKTTMSVTNAEAIAAWNRRASPTPPTKEGRQADKISAIAMERADWLLDAIACSLQDRRFLRGDKKYDAGMGRAILLNADKAIQTAITRALSSPRVEGVRREALEEAARVAEKLADELARLKGSGDRRVQIGSHLETCATIAAGIRSLSPPDGDGKQEQATRASGPTAPTDLLQSKESYK